jgi:hypothetical protein
VILRSLAAVLTIAGCVGAASSQDARGAGAQMQTVDFRYAPAYWQTSISLPDDWQKTLVAKDGALLYDYPGAFNGFKTKITAFPDAEWVRQELLSPRAPIVRTYKRSGSLEIVEEAFAVAPPIASRAPAPKPPIDVVRLDSDATALNWASPKGDVDPAFASAAIGWGEPIRYRIRSAGQGEYTVVFGLCEGHYDTAGRVLALRIEGKTRRTVDMAAEYGRNTPALFPFAAKDENGDGVIDIAVAAAERSPDKNTVLSVLWIFEGEQIPAESDLLAGKGEGTFVHIACGLEPGALGPPRNDVLIVRIRNRGDAPSRVSPQVRIESEAPIATDDVGKHVSLGPGTTLTCAQTYNWSRPADNPALLIIWYPDVELAPGEEYVLAFGIGRGPHPADIPERIAQAEELRDRALRWWEKDADLPYGRIEVPDPQIQALLDSSIRNIYQAREKKKREWAFQVGPTCYRGVWVADGAFILEAITFLGRWQETRSGIRHLLSFQGSDGSISLIGGHWKETGIALWTVTRHARLTGDRKWLQSVWPAVERGVEFIRSLRRRTMADPNAPNAGLIPAGFSDGGLGGVHPEYTNVYWSLVGMGAAADAARWLGKTDQADAWDREYDDFYATFRRAADRDMRDDGRGHRYLPIQMDDPAGAIAPQKAQWGFCHAVFPGRLFAKDDPLVLGNLAMLQAVEKQGMVAGTGWLNDGIWTYFGSFYAHSWLWQGDGRKAAQILYAFADHASPTLCWREEQGLVGTDAINGDMPHNWASGEFIRLVRNLLVLERGDELHLCEGMPAEWAQPGATVKLRDVLTEFGPLSLELRVADDGCTARLSLTAPSRTRPAKLVLHLDGWSGKSGAIDLPTKGRTEKEIDLR